MPFSKSSKIVSVIYAALLALVNPVQSMAVGPLPPGGSPVPVLTGIILSGPAVVDEQTSTQYTCTGKYSDLTTSPIDAIWEINTTDASISSGGLLSVGNISANQDVTITASVGGYSQSLNIVIQNVAPVLTGITISGPSTLAEEASAQYTCTGKYSDLTTMTIDAVWEINTTDASIDDAGLLTVGNISVDQAVTITASVGGYLQSLDLVIQSVAPVLTGITISGPSTLAEESSAQYTCSASYSDGSTLSVVPSWTVSSSSAGIDTAGVLTALNVDSDELISISASFNGKTDSFAVTIVDAPAVLESLVIQGNVSLDENTSIQLNCIAQYSDGSSPLINPLWSVGSSSAQISQTGLLSAGDVTADVGVTVTASLNGLTDSHSVLIKYIAPVLERIAVTGPSAVAEEESANYTCTAYYDDGTSKVVAPEWNENSSYATVSSSGTLSTLDVPSDQSLTLTANYGGKSNSIGVQIIFDIPVLLSLSIEGATIVDEHASTHYSCTASYSDGSFLEIDPIWGVSAELALMSVDGNLSAGEVGRDELIDVTASYGGLTTSLEVVLKDIPNHQVLLESLTISGAKEVVENESIYLTCQASYSDGSIQTVTPIWDVASALASISEDGLFKAGNVQSDVVVDVTASFGGLDTSHAISVAVLKTQIIYPLSGFEGQTVMAEIYDHQTGDWSSYGPSEAPSELVLEDLGTNGWYWISISESNSTSGVWDEVQANWLHL